MYRTAALVVALLGILCPSMPAAAAEAPLVEKYLTEGRLAVGEKELQQHLRNHPDDDQARFGLGTLQFLKAVERLGQSLHRYGALGPQSRLARAIPLVRLPVPQNPKPEPIGYEDSRKMVEQWLADMQAVEQTLAPIKDREVKLPLHFGLIALDLNGDGQAGGDETLWRIYAVLNNGLRLSPEFTPEEVQNFVIAFDYGDVHWLRGYCRLLSAIGEMTLAYDQRSVFDAIAHQLFDNPKGAAIPEELFPRREDRPFESEIADFIAAIHLARFPLKEPQRMQAARKHLLAVVEHSRESWKAIAAETDDDREWIPSSKQKGVIPNVQVSAEMIQGWQSFLGEAEQLLEGKKLVPHWRLVEGRGVNLKRVFDEPREFDLVMWVHGAAAVPYVEAGPTTQLETWTRLNALFGGQFIGFAFWFN
ncbi:MAG TPA: hypothetical protein VFB80_22195 [Pirellulaceae bacterium]|nr:hypothetical protein [Pirellulaceae bacterium]